MKKVVVLVCFLLVGFSAWSDGSALTGGVGLAPTSMGTVGERLEVVLILPPWLRVRAEGYNDRYLVAASDMELYGGPVFGDSYRNATVGRVELSTSFSAGPARISADASGRYEYGQGYAIVRLLEPDIGLPEDTSRFMDIKTTESILDFAVGLGLVLDLGILDISASANVSPLARWTIDRSRFLTGVTFVQTGVISSGTIVYPTLSWSVRQELLELDALKYGGTLTAGYELVRPSMNFEAFFSFARRSFSGLADIFVTGYIPYKTGNGSDAVSDLPLQIIEAEQTNAAMVEIVHDELEAGLDIRFGFLKPLLRLRSAPGLAVSYGIQSRKQVYDYLDDDPSLSAEQWIERFGFIRLLISFGF